MSATIGLALFALSILALLVGVVVYERVVHRRADAAARRAALEREARRRERTSSTPPRFRARVDVQEALEQVRRKPSGDRWPVVRGEVTAPQGHTTAPGPGRKGGSDG